jgi:hypothetical protein
MRIVAAGTALNKVACGERMHIAWAKDELAQDVPRAALTSETLHEDSHFEEEW